MYKVGYIDDSAKTFTNYTYGLLEYDIELICTNEKMSKVQLVNWVLDNQIEAVMIDYKLNPKFEFVGTELIAYLNDKLPGLQCVVLTSYKSNSLEEKLVPKGLTYDRVLIYPTGTMRSWMKDHSKTLQPKTKSQFYVAITRARYSVGIVFDYDEKISIEGVEKYQ